MITTNVSFEMNQYNHASHMMQIDQFVRAVYLTDASLHFISDEIARLSPNLQINLSIELQYSPAILIYAECLEQLRQIGLVDFRQLTNQHLSDFQSYVRSQWVRVIKKDKDFKLQEQKNRQGLEEYLGNLLNHYARLLLVRVDFAIKQEYQHEIDIVQFRNLMATMSNRYSNKDGCFSDLQGYAWAIEQGLNKGFHCHTLLIYDGSKHQNDFGIASQIAHYWKQLTLDKGYCFISNDSNYKSRFDNRGKLGIGMIHRDNLVEVQNAINTALYLVNPEKDQQNLRLWVPRTRTFGTGVFDVSWRRGIYSK